MMHECKECERSYHSRKALAAHNRVTHGLQSKGPDRTVRYVTDVQMFALFEIHRKSIESLREAVLQISNRTLTLLKEIKAESDLLHARIDAMPAPIESGSGQVRAERTPGVAAVSQGKRSRRQGSS